MPIMPIVNLNGTNREELLEQQKAVWGAASALIEALLNAYPHGRDYQLNSDQDYRAARDEHDAHIKAVTKVRDHSAAIAYNLNQS